MSGLTKSMQDDINFLRFKVNALKTEKADLIEALEHVSLGIYLHYETMEQDTAEVQYLVELKQVADKAIEKAGGRK